MKIADNVYNNCLSNFSLYLKDEEKELAVAKDSLLKLSETLSDLHCPQ